MLHSRREIHFPQRTTAEFRRSEVETYIQKRVDRIARLKGAWVKLSDVNISIDRVEETVPHLEFWCPSHVHDRTWKMGGPLVHGRLVFKVLFFLAGPAMLTNVLEVRTWMYNPMELVKLYRKIDELLLDGAPLWS